MEMKEHGDYVVSRSIQTILFSARGPWNDQSMSRGTKQMGKLIKQLDLTKPWGCLSCLYGESLMPPSTFKAFEKQTKIRKSLGMQALAVVILDSDIANTTKSQLSKAYESAGVDFEFHADVESAMSWLTSKDMQFDKTQVIEFFQQNTFPQSQDF